MKQVLRKGLKDIVVEEVPDPIAIPHHVLIRPAFSLISSGTETASIHRQGLVREVADNPSHINKILNVMRSTGPIRTLAEVRAKFNEYSVLGYSGAGVVVDKHESIRDLEVGDRVAYGGEGTGHGETVLTGRNLVARVPDTVTLEHASFTTLGSIALNALRTAGIGVGDIVAVIGLGLVGQLISQLVRLQGGVVIGVDLRPDRVDLARTLGADYATSTDRVMEQVGALTEGRGVDCAIVAAAAKSSSPAELALTLCRDRGKMVVVGAVGISLPWEQMYLKEIQLFMSRAYGPGSYDTEYEKGGVDYPISYVRWSENRNMEEFLRLASLGRVQLEPLISHRFDHENAPRAYETILDPSSESLAVLLRYRDGGRDLPAAAFKPKTRVEVRSTSASSSDLRAAVIGAGNLARWAHLPNLKKVDGVQLHAVCSSSGARGRNYAERFGAKYCTSDYNDILCDESIDIVLVLSRNQHHAPQALAALRAGKHVFLEKPMAITEDECHELIETAEQTGRYLTVGFNRRFAPFYLEMKRQLSRRTGPAIINIRVSSPDIAGSYWMADPKIGGAILGEACHFADLMYWLVEAEPTRVCAFSLPTGKKEPIGENNLAAAFHFDDGSIANLTYATTGSRASAGERVEAFAAGIGVVVEDFKRLTIAGRVSKKQSCIWPKKGYLEQMTAFIDAIRKGSSPAVTARDGARATIVCLRMLDSARRGTAVDIQPGADGVMLKGLDGGK
jgi:predicted dehydrogenase/threonine dehydrogenase-like Zn-dependent dehydrogenase